MDAVLNYYLPALHGDVEIKIRGYLGETLLDVYKRQIRSRSRMLMEKNRTFISAMRQVKTII